MKAKSACLMTGLLFSLLGPSLYFMNPNLVDYQQSILVSLADHEADMLAAADRRAIEAEAAMLTSRFIAARYDLRRLDIAVLRENHPLLGPALPHQHESSGKTLTETLSMLKERAIQRTLITREAMRYGILVELTSHTKRRSYGIWSNFSTCLGHKIFSYWGVAGRFYARTDHDCAAADPVK